ncbi:methyltransferase domain-containing protein [Thalassobellus citreus]|uniref:methyltransferase domain-containing protein n=1 Tax=Thalassobellus citreus TaxID=3367752 RepID=UPI003789AEE1
MYSEGTYFKDPSRHTEDSRYKAGALKKILIKYLSHNSFKLTSYADVGCGSGEVIKVLGKELKHKFNTLKTLKGFDISPHVKNLEDDIITFSCEDFIKSNEKFDLVTLNDVFEHIPNPISFLTKVGERAKLVVMHIPLENCFSINIRNLQKNKIKNPGHLVFLDINSAINLITYSGLQIIDYEYSKGAIKAPSNNKTFLQKATYPFKAILLRLNPYVFSKFFGISLIVIAKGID